MAKQTSTKRKSKNPSLAQQKAAQAQVEAAQAHLHQDEIGGIHDEADVMSFRGIALQRFIFNQELLENVTDKWIHTNSIIPSRPFTNINTSKNSINEIKGELYFGNIKLMKQKLEQLELEIKQLEENNDKEINNILKPNKLLSTSLEELSNINTTQYHSVQEQLKKLESDYTSTVNKKTVSKTYIIRSIPSINNNTSEAPPTYWEDLRKTKEEQAAREAAELQAKEAALQAEKDAQERERLQAQQAIPQSHSDQDTNDLVITDSFIQHDSENYVDQNGFGNEDINMIDDVGFGLHGGLDDQDFLSQI
ncbi:hypothetical protein WICMUC_004028 [Wickerhamomyces mucosus]|uniref:Uncharacterized protein n=1 Tax=Wickerhamomyces mucosus TaxID=1378264 RepID=A0A9P8PIS6_9ASCO|nr:hypothetical protein WICMUC_004028 [Wickerhamomyces mucosus]